MCALAKIAALPVLALAAFNDLPLLEVVNAGRSHLPEITREDRAAAVASRIEIARLRSSLDVTPSSADGGGLAAAIHSVQCPADGAGIGHWPTAIEKHHFLRHMIWADEKFCEHGTGLWSRGCKEMCPLRAVTVGLAAGLGPGQRVLDIGSGCGHVARWFEDWFGAGTVGLDFVGEAVAHARKVAGRDSTDAPSPRKFCLMDVAVAGLEWLPADFFDLATAISVLHYMRVDHDLWELPKHGNRSTTKTPCAELRATLGTQCRVARDMFRSLRTGGRLWISHNGSYHGKWDPKRVWGAKYWRCCFGPELAAGTAEVKEVPEQDMFLHSPNWDATYSVVARKVARM